MISIKGRSVFGSIARGLLTFYHRDEFIINKIKVSDPELEYKKYVKAKNAALVELGELYDRARLSVAQRYLTSISMPIMRSQALQEALRKCWHKWTVNICKAERLTSRTFQTGF